MLLTMPLHPDMGRNVLNLLEKLNPLPTTGFIAGQSVISALLMLYGKGNSGPVNDIDIYKNDNRINHRLRHLSFQPELNQIGYFKPTPEMMKKPHYEGLTQFFTTKRISLFHISEVSNDKLLNIIKIKSADDSLNVTPYQVLESFDINMVKVGVDLKNKKLYWTADFDFFIKTGQLQVTNTHSVFHTSCRIAKKLQEMPWIYTDHAINYKTLVLPSQISKKMHGKAYQFNAYFGKKYFNIFNQHPELSKLFDVKEKENKSKNNTKSTGLYTCTFKEDLTKHVTENDTNLYSELLTNNFKSKEHLVAAHALSRHFINKQYLQKGKHYNNALNTLSTSNADYTCAQISLLEQNYLDGQVQLEWAERIEKFIKKHDKLTYLFTGHALDTQSKIYTNIKKLQATYGEHVIGLIETIAITISDILDYKQMASIVADYNKKLTTPFKDFEPLPTKKYGNIQIRDLPNKLSIKSEGTEMHHCVGGYAESVNKSRCRILSISDITNINSRTSRSTAEVSAIDNRKAELLGLKINSKTDNKINDFKYPISVVQHRAFANATPSAEHKTVLAQYINEHNTQYIKPDEKIKNCFLYSEIEGIEQKINMLYLGNIEKVTITRMQLNETITKFINSNYYVNNTPVAGIKVQINNNDIADYLIYADTEKLYISVSSTYNTDVMPLELLEKHICSNQTISLDMNKQLAYFILKYITNLELSEWKLKIQIRESDPKSKMKLNGRNCDEEHGILYN